MGRAGRDCFFLWKISFRENFLAFRLAQPFTALYTLKTPQRPSAVHLAAESFYLHMVFWRSYSYYLINGLKAFLATIFAIITPFQSSISPPHFDFVFNDADGSPSRAAIPRGARNLFAAILSFIHHVKVSRKLTVINRINVSMNSSRGEAIV